MDMDMQILLLFTSNNRVELSLDEIEQDSVAGLSRLGVSVELIASSSKFISST